MRTNSPWKFYNFNYLIKNWIFHDFEKILPKKFQGLSEKKNIKRFKMK